nr:hypothetical protein [Tanacetum cinerariifolium]
MNEDTPVGVASAIQECVIPYVVDMAVENEKLCSLDDTTVMGSFPPLSMLGATATGNAPRKSSYANITSKPSGKKVNVRTLFTPRGNGIDVVVLVVSIHAISERFANTAYGYFLGKKVAYPVVSNYVRNTWDDMLENGPWFIRNNLLILKKWHSDESLLKEDVRIVLVWVRLHGVPVMAFSMGRLSYARVMIKLRADVELKDNIVVAMSKITRKGHHTCNNTCAGEKKTVKKLSQTSRGVLVGPKMGFKPQKEYRHVPKKTTTSSSGNKKKGVEPTIEVSKFNPFDVLNSVDNDEELVIDGQVFLVDKAGNPLKKVEYPGDLDSKDEVASVDNDMAHDLASERTGFGTQNPYVDDMYEGQDISEEIQTICDKLDIRVQGHKKQ